MIIVHKKVNKKICYGLTWREYKCQCSYKECTSSMIDENLIDAYENLRGALSVPLQITSGYRCPRHNEKVNGVKTSRHKAGMAIDIAFNATLHSELLKIKNGMSIYKKVNDTPAQLYQLIANDCGFSRVIYYKTKNFFHLEV